MRILINEFIKVFNKKTIILIFIALLILNVTLLNINDTDDLEKNHSYSSQDYNKIYKDIDGLTNQEALELLNHDYKKLNIFFSFDIMDNNSSFRDEESYDEIDIEELRREYETGTYIKYTDST